MLGRRAGARDAFDVGDAALRNGIGFVEQARDDLAQGRLVAHGACGLAGQKAQHRHRHVGQKLRPDRLPDLFDRRRFDRGAVEGCAQDFDPLGEAVVAFADQEPVPLGREICDQAWLDDLVRRKDHAADDALPGDCGTQRAAGIEKGEIGRRRMVLRQADIVPPGNAVLCEQDRCGGGEQRFEAGGKTVDTGRLQRADHEVLFAEIGRIVGSLHFGRDLGVSDAQRQALCLHRLEVRSAHHAGDIMAGLRQPHRKMTADRTRAENADSHGVERPVRSG